MNYTWCRANRVKIGNIKYYPVLDKTIVWIEEAGDLHLTLHYADRSFTTLSLNAPVMVQVCHRRCYERSVHHNRIDPGKAMMRVERKLSWK